MTDRALDRSPHGELQLYPILRWLVILVAVAPIALGAAALGHVANPGRTGYGQPDESDGIGYLIMTAYAAIHFAVAVPYVACAAGVWYRKRWGFVTIAILCSLQCVIQAGRVLLAIAGAPDFQAFLYGAYTIALLACAVLAVLAMNSLTVIRRDAA